MFVLLNKKSWWISRRWRRESVGQISPPPPMKEEEEERKESRPPSLEKRKKERERGREGPVNFLMRGGDNACGDGGKKIKQEQTQKIKVRLRGEKWDASSN